MFTSGTHFSIYIGPNHPSMPIFLWCDNQFDWCGQKLHLNLTNWLCLSFRRILQPDDYQNSPKNLGIAGWWGLSGVCVCICTCICIPVVYLHYNKHTETLNIIPDVLLCPHERQHHHFVIHGSLISDALFALQRQQSKNHSRPILSTHTGLFLIRKISVNAPLWY